MESAQIKNPRMALKIQEGEARDISGYRIPGTADYKLPVGWMPELGMDYCDAQEWRWIWVIVRNQQTKEVMASQYPKWYRQSGYDVLWLR